ncbi:MAG: NAD(P)H-dependent oxidoreductase [Bacilli bacterium]|nr:NAD(P)H-dependent oxidoreductase [Bacilli bacterium]
MKIVLINGTNHKGSTYHIARQLVDKVSGELTEFFLPKDFDEFCLGCTTCFVKGEANCPHHSKIEKITKALLESDLIILDSPVYVFHASGAMKALLDHYGYMWMSHRPEEAMFKKQGVVISTAAGAGIKSTLKDMRDSLFYWGVGKVYQFGLPVAATSYEQIIEKKLKKIDGATTKLAAKINKRNGKVKPGFKTKAFFFLMHLLQKDGWNPKDADYWKEKGWTGKARPWKTK